MSLELEKFLRYPIYLIRLFLLSIEHLDHLDQSGLLVIHILMGLEALQLAHVNPQLNHLVQQMDVLLVQPQCQSISLLQCFKNLILLVFKVDSLIL